ncbi:MAG: hypothetical protein LBQ81_04135 [Zoogloeaceae bacterium]|jgi:hypothetical protein|nr:hypothetical protein [Zoogloeaceae bacterium]
MPLPRKSSGYAPRNALNADRLKADIAARSEKRGDRAEVRDWLLNHFFRHLVANFEPAQNIATLEAARQALFPESLPKWVIARFRATEMTSGAVPLVWVNPETPQILALEGRLLEFLDSRQGTALAGKLNRVNCPQALAIWEKEHAEMATRIGRGWRQSQPEALRKWLATANGMFVEFLSDSAALRAEMAFESYMMRHCLGQFADRQALTGGYGESYAKAIERKALRLISFRDTGGQPHITISLEVLAEGKLRVEQVKGKQNRPPVERYVDDLLACLNQINTNEETPEDCIRIGVVRTPDGWRRIESVRDAAMQTRLVVRYPQLFHRLASPTPMVEWLIAARQPELFAEHAPQSAAIRYALRPRKP